jgi:hypothetical protein
MMQGNEMHEDRISIREMFLEIEKLIRHIFSRWLRIGIYTSIIAALLITYEFITKEVFTAETTFIIEKEQSGASDFGKAAANLVGVSLGSMGQASGLFNSDHIEKLYLSNRMLKETFLSYCTIRGEEARLITHFGKEAELLEEWSKSNNSENFTFEVPESQFTVSHDSILFEVFDGFKKNQLVVERPDRKLEILGVRVSSTDKLFAKKFNEILVENVNSFYLKVKTKKTGENVRVLKTQMDSLKALLDLKVEYLDSLKRRFPNFNPNFSNISSENSKVVYEMQATGAAYVEITKNYEMAKITHLNNTPIIQLIDTPVLPLESSKDKLIKTIVLSILIGGVLSVIYTVAMYVYLQVMEPQNKL